MAQWTSPAGGTPVGAHREDLSDMIYDVSPSETVFLSAIGSGDASAIQHDWPRDNLTAPTTPNVQAEGVTFAALAAAGGVPATPPVVRLGNICQISALGVDVTGTAEVIDKAGRDSQMAYQRAKRLRELKMQVDKQCLSPDGAAGVIKSLANAAYGNNRTGASLSTWLLTDLTAFPAGPTGSRGTGGTNPGTGIGDTLPGDGTTRAFQQKLLDDALATVWRRSGRVPKQIILGDVQKRAFSMFDGVGNAGTFPGSASAGQVGRVDRARGIIYATADVYMSNWGRLMVTPSRHIRRTAGFDRELFLIEPEYLSYDTLRPWQQLDIAVLGDSRQMMMLVEGCLQVKNQDCHIIIPDLKDQS